MRLLVRNNVGEICLTRNFLDDEVPAYAILSHTWGTEEVSFNDLRDGTGKNKIGYDKIRFCGDRACTDNLGYFWVDTCCIDKTSSAELQEAINCMFRWYHDAAKCYVYLADVSEVTCDTDNKPLAWESAFRNSRWFTRGWTLQELLAPALVEFFSKEGLYLGNKKSLEQHIHSSTGIPVDALRGSTLSQFTVPERMAWIDDRETTRKEDKAYSLLGIFDVQMPLLYGEGRERAFKRLMGKVGKAAKGGLQSIPIVKDATFDSRAEEHSPRCYPDTRTDLLHQIKEWAKDPRSKCIFWLNGAAGTGKSTISRTVAGLFQERGVLGASFFFKRGERDRGHAAQFFTTVALQLVSREPRMLPFVREAIDSDPTISTKALREQFEKLILQPLDQIHSGPEGRPTMVVVVDALDECDNDNDIKLIIYLFSQVRALRSVHLRVFITSRPELPIRLSFKDMVGKYQDVPLHQIPESVIEHDISAFFHSEFARIRVDYNSQAFDNQQLPLDWPGEQIIQSLVDMAVPLFIFAATVCRFVADETWPDPIGQLSKVLNYHRGGDSELDRLDSTYLPVLGQLAVGKTDSTKSRLVTGFQRLIGTIILLAEPLSALSLSQLLDVSTTSITGVLNGLHAVLDIPSKAHLPIRLFHLSFRDFLTDPAKHDKTEFWIDEVKSHRVLVTDCILRLESFLKKDICNLKTPGNARSEVDTNDLETSLPAHIQYACLYWTSHLEQSKERIREGDHIHMFLKYHFLHWLEALSLMGRISEAIMIMRTLRTLVGPNCAEVSFFLYDAYRFVLNCISAANIAPLQLYYSAVIFAPESSVMRRLPGVPRWVAAKRGVEDNWSPCLRALEAHSQYVNAVAFSPDGTFMASASADRTIKIWDAVTGQCRQTLEGHSQHVNSVAFSSGGTLVASASADQTVKIWDAATGQCRQTFEGHSFAVNSVACSPDGTLVASASADRTIKIWDAATGQCLQTLMGHSSYVNSVTFSPDNTLVASASADYTIKVWDVVTGQCRQTLEGHSLYVSTATFSPDGILIVSASADETVKIWDAAAGQCYQTLEGHSDSVNSAAFSPDGTLIASASADRTVKIWDAATGQCRQTFEGHSFAVNSVACSPDGTLVASASADRTIKIWDIVTSQYCQTLMGHRFAVNSVAISTDGTPVISASADRTIKIWDAVTGQCRQTLEGHSQHVNTVAFSSGGTLVASASADQTVKIWDAATGQCRQTFEGHSFAVNSVAFSPDGTLIASASADRTLKIWDAATGECHQTLEGHSFAINSVAFSPDGTLIASASADRTLKIWDAATGECHQTLEGHSFAINSVAFSPDGTLIASASADRTLKIWNAATGECHQTLEGHSFAINSVAFSPDGTLIASASADRTIKIWDTAIGEQYQTLVGHNFAVNSVVFSPDGTLIASASADRTIKIWDAATGQWCRTLVGHSSAVNSVACSVASIPVASASADRTIK
ncbi:hypothetical protein ARSEF4850_003037, partial [Beauveria asiatica]